MRKIPPWIWVTGAIVGVWYLSKPKAAGASNAATGAGTGVSSGALDAGRMHGHGGGGRFHGGPRGFVGHSVDYVDFGSPIQCDPRYTCARQPVLPCRCG